MYIGENNSASLKVELHRVESEIIYREEIQGVDKPALFKILH